MQTSQHQVVYRRLVFAFVTLRVPIADLNRRRHGNRDENKKTPLCTRCQEEK